MPALPKDSAIEMPQDSRDGIPDIDCTTIAAAIGGSPILSDNRPSPTGNFFNLPNGDQVLPIHFAAAAIGCGAFELAFTCNGHSVSPNN